MHVPINGKTLARTRMYTATPVAISVIMAVRHYQTLLSNTFFCRPVGQFSIQSYSMFAYEYCAYHPNVALGVVQAYPDPFQVLISVP